MDTKLKIFIALITIFFTSLIIAGPILSKVENPQYKVLSKENNIEIREYSPIIIAEVNVTGDRKEAVNKGFRILADYIFGNNTVKAKISMTAPVQQKSNEKISMTAPVTQKGENNEWQVSFIMPKKYTLETLPKPNNEAVKIKEIGSKKYIAVIFSGFASAKNIQKNQQILDSYILKNKIKNNSKIIYAFYNPPWTLPFMRRNEIMYEI